MPEFQDVTNIVQNLSKCFLLGS